MITRLSYFLISLLALAGSAEPASRLVLARPSYALGGLQLDKVTVLGLEISSDGVLAYPQHAIQAGNVISGESPMMRESPVHPFVTHRGKDLAYVAVNRQSKNSTERVKQRAIIESIRDEIRSAQAAIAHESTPPAEKARYSERLETQRDLLSKARKREKELDQDFGLTELVRLRLFEAGLKSDSVYLPWRHVSSLLEVRNRLLLGMPGRIEYIDLDRPYRKPAVLYESPVGAHGKTIDAMARCDDMLIAIDDVSSPKYAHAFALDNPTTFPVYRYTVDLPFGANSHYREAASSETNLALLATFSSKGTRGAAIEFYRCTPQGIEHVKSSVETTDHTGRRGHVLAGIRQTSFSGLVCLGDTVLVAARERGVLVLPHAKSELPSARYLKGICTDVTRQGSQAFALVQIGGATTIVVLELRNGGLLEVYRHRIPMKMTEFID
jgi:hypothetical protein